MRFKHLRRRILKIKPSVKNLNLDDSGMRPVTLIVDASGLTITKKGDYIEQNGLEREKSLSSCILQSMLNQKRSYHLE
ncbi:MAG: hypothetical protein ACRD8Z_07675 [Nitrososphaeraceae archaeon]